MKINGPANTVGKAADSGQPRTVRTPRPTAPETTSSEQVAISPLSARLQEIEAGMGSAPVVNAARVAEIKQAIADGRFKINPERIADGLLTSVRQMLARSN